MITQFPRISQVESKVFRFPKPIFDNREGHNHQELDVLVSPYTYTSRLLELQVDLMTQYRCGYLKLKYRNS